MAGPDAHESRYAPQDCHGFRIVPVYGRMDDTLKARVVNLWKRHDILPGKADIERRLEQVVCVAFDPYGELAAVNTAYPKAFDGHTYMAYRIFIRPHNGEPSLKIEMTRIARELLRALALPEQPSGLMVVLENPKLSRAEIEQALLLKGYRPGGLNRRGRQVWLFDF